MQIRDATPDDLPAILAIHNDAIENSVAIWTDEPVDLAERAGWLESHRRQGFAVLVAVEGDELLGYASLSAWHTKSGFRHTVEDSIYLHPDATGRGLGRELLGALIERARAGDYHVVVADIEAGNAASIRLHASFGFEHCGTVREVGIKFGRWLDLTTMRLPL
ncbi:GNAT family N-acetyltransferase [Subtercola boreus]|uniref:GNAT family N-acetyltransferase n=1 Tax=Subtercola boreus TaxID=120213 RepID=A0A3E0VKW0_9MICO|nr:GNAT family N-acetyltransferase [Subtercola boreus]RFA10526.1 GNAT family N-acetyltransferase [Subtercola boreus]TQL55937.1 phosphinothricin acetyltransferase [Subtercola boreus]